MVEFSQARVSKCRYDLFLIFTKADKLYNGTLDAIIPYQTVIFTKAHVYVEIYKLRIDCLKQLSAEVSNEKDLRTYEKEAIRLYAAMKEQSDVLLNEIKNEKPDEYYIETTSSRYYYNDFKKL